MNLHIARTAMSRIHVSPGVHHYSALYRAPKRHIDIVANKRTGEQWECVVFQNGTVIGVFRVGRCTDSTVNKGTIAVLNQANGTTLAA